MHTLAGQGVKVGGQGGHQGFAFAGLHFGDAPLMEHDAADELHGVGPHAQHAVGGLAHRSKGFGQQGVQAFAAFVALFELGGFALQLFVAQGLVRRFQLQDLVHDRLNVFQLTVAVGTKNFIKKSHTLLPFGNEFLDTLIVEVYHSISLYAKGKTRFSRQTGHFYRLFINIQQDIVP